MMAEPNVAVERVTKQRCHCRVRTANNVPEPRRMPRGTHTVLGW